MVIGRLSRPAHAADKQAFALQEKLAQCLLRAGSGTLPQRQGWTGSCEVHGATGADSKLSFHRFGCRGRVTRGPQGRKEPLLYSQLRTWGAAPGSGTPEMGPSSPASWTGGAWKAGSLSCLPIHSLLVSPTASPPARPQSHLPVTPWPLPWHRSAAWPCSIHQGHDS